MANNPSSKKWTDIRGMAVVIPSEGKKVGIVKDFYFEPDTNAVRALRVEDDILEARILIAESIDAIGKDTVTTANEQTLIIERHAGDIISLPTGDRLLSYKVMGEGGTVVGTVGNVLLDTSRPHSLRIVAFELTDNPRATFSANEVTGYKNEAVIILDKAAKGVR